MIHLGIVGCNYGCTIQLPAFRIDPRCEVVALSGTDQARTAERARQFGIPAAFGDWRVMIEKANINAIAIATPPQVQPQIAIEALKHGKAVFAEKPMASDIATAAAMMKAASNHSTMVDFSFTEILAWRKAKAIINSGAIGKLRHVIVTWTFESHSTLQRLRNWKTSAAEGGGALGNFASHSLHYFEWFCGPITEVSAQLANLPDDPQIEATASLALTFSSGATGSLALSSASFLGSEHRLEFFGEDGSLVLSNMTGDYMRGFTLSHAQRPASALMPMAVDPDPRDRPSVDGRIAPVSRLATRFIDAIQQRRSVLPGFVEGYRVQVLLDAARRSHALGQRLEVRTPTTIADPLVR